MPPKPRRKNTNLPKYVTESNGRIVYRPRVPPQDRAFIETDKSGFLKPPIRLGSITDTENTILSAYLTAKSFLESKAGAERHTLRWIVQQYQASKHFKDLATGSQKRAESLANILDHSITINGQDCTLGDLAVTACTMPVVRRLAEKRLDDYQAEGHKGNAVVNRQITFLSTAVRWAMNHIDGLGLVENPFRIMKFEETPSERYVDDKEYEIQANAAQYDYLPVLFEITYLIASRGAETLDIKLSDIDPNRATGGINVTRRKGSKSNFIEWSDRLYAAYQAATALHKKHKVLQIDAPLIISSQGRTLTRSGLDSAMQRLKKRMIERGLGTVFWTLHDLKRKGCSDSNDDRIAGHVSPQMRERYNVKQERRKPAR